MWELNRGVLQSLYEIAYDSCVMDCFICMERCSFLETRFIKEYVEVPCACTFFVHIKCYNDWRLTTTMLCPICRIHEKSREVQSVNNYDTCVRLTCIYLFITIMVFLFFQSLEDYNHNYRHFYNNLL